MTDNKRVDRGRATQEIVAAEMRGLGFVHAESQPASRKGVDVLNTPGLAVEVKATESTDPKNWTEQAAKNATRDPQGNVLDVPMTFYRPRGYGAANLDKWPVIIRWADVRELLRAGGYLPVTQTGEGLPDPTE